MVYEAIPMFLDPGEQELREGVDDRRALAGLVAPTSAMRLSLPNLLSAKRVESKKYKQPLHSHSINSVTYVWQTIQRPASSTGIP